MLHQSGTVHCFIGCTKMPSVSQQQVRSFSKSVKIVLILDPHMGKDATLDLLCECVPYPAFPVEFSLLVLWALSSMAALAQDFSQSPVVAAEALLFEP